MKIFLNILILISFLFSETELYSNQDSYLVGEHIEVYFSGLNSYGSDWIGIFEKSKKIDTVTTSNFYIFEKIDLSCIPTIYSKNNNHRTFEENFGWKQKLASKEYEYIS